MSEFIKMKLSEARAKFEQIDEVSDPVLTSYTNKVTLGVDPKSGTRNSNDIRTLRKKANANAILGNDQEASRLKSKAEKRGQGLTQAFARMGGDAAPGSPVDKARKKIPSSYLNREETGLTEGAAIMKHFHGEDGDHDGSPNRAEWDHDTIVKHLANTIGTTHPVYKSVKADLKKATALHHRADRHYDNPDKHMDLKDQARDYEEGAKATYANHLKLARTHKEEVENLAEIGDTERGQAALNSFVVKSLAPSSEKSISNLASRGGFEHGERGDKDPQAGEKYDAKSRNRSLSVLAAIRRLTKEEAEDLEEDVGAEIADLIRKKNAASPIARKNIEAQIAKLKAQRSKMAEETKTFNESACMTDTSSGGADQIAQSKVGEIYKKPSKSRDAMNATAINKRVPAVESAILDVMAKTFEKRKMFEDASNISIISPAQRQDWLNVSTGNMEVVDYFNKYKV